MNSPDDYVGISAGDLTQETYENLAEVWPAAHHAVTALLKRVEDGQQHPASSDFDIGLATLVQETI